MKKRLVLFFVLIGLAQAYGQKVDYNDANGYLASGYDVVAYFSKKPQKGNSKFTFKYQQTKLKFISQKNLNIFKANPTKYLPQYGGWCAYAMAKTGEKVAINPKTYEIRNGKLYLFYNKYFTNTLDSWKKENPAALVKKANANWKKIKNKG